MYTLSSQAAGFSHQLPKTGYAKALDIWMSTCLAFLFGALIEFTIVNTLMRKAQMAASKVVFMFFKLRDKFTRLSHYKTVSFLIQSTAKLIP